MAGLGFCPGFSVFAQQTLWVKQVFGPGTSLRPYGLFTLDQDRCMLIFKADGRYETDRKAFENADTSAVKALIINSSGSISQPDSIPNYILQSIAGLHGNQWLLRTEARNGNYFLAYGPSTPLRLPIGLTWNLAYLDGNGHRLWEFHLPENQHIARLTLLANGHCLLAGYETTNNGDRNIFIALWNEYGQELWRRAPGSRFGDEAMTSAIDAENNLYVGGYFTADSTFMGNTADLSGNEQDGFVACYTKEGKQKFFYRQRGQGWNAVDQLAVNALGKVFFVATVRGSDWRLAPFGFPRKGRQDLVVGLIDPKQDAGKPAPITVFPNPAREIVFFGLNQTIGKGKLTARLHKKDGTVLQQMTMGNAKGTSFRFNVANTPPGPYFITVEGGKTKATERVVVE